MARRTRCSVTEIQPIEGRLGRGTKIQAPIEDGKTKLNCSIAKIENENTPKRDR